MKLFTTIAAAGLAATAIALSSGSAESTPAPVPGAFEVTITNITRGQIFAPALVATHNLSGSVFTAGGTASPELAALAEDGDTSLLAAMLGSDANVFDVQQGAGMIHPNMATTLGYVATDLAIEPDDLQGLLSREIATSFNAISVDGDTSTNDAVYVLASGESKVNYVEVKGAFESALRAVLQSLAKQVARDGEGATRLMEVQVKGAPDAASAHAIARSICSSTRARCAYSSAISSSSRRTRAGCARTAAASQASSSTGAHASASSRKTGKSDP